MNAALIVAATSSASRGGCKGSGCDVYSWVILIMFLLIAIMIMFMVYSMNSNLMKYKFDGDYYNKRKNK